MQKERKANVRVLAEARMEMRLSPQDKALINQAASLKGSNATAFVLASALSEARRLLGDNAEVRLSGADLALLKTSSGAPVLGSTALQEALLRHRGLDSALASLFQRLDPARHELGSFDCGDERQNEFLQRQALTQERFDLARVYVLTDALVPSRVLGYYTLSAISLGGGGSAIAAPPLPALRLGRLALDRGLQGRNLGALLLADAVLRSAEAADIMPVFALLAAPRDEPEEAWYEGYGFRRFADQAGTLFLPLAGLA